MSTNNMISKNSLFIFIFVFNIVVVVVVFTTILIHRAHPTKDVNPNYHVSNSLEQVPFCVVTLSTGYTVRSFLLYFNF